jgi:hypothetical protein
VVKHLPRMLGAPGSFFPQQRKKRRNPSKDRVSECMSEEEGRHKLGATQVQQSIW